MAVQTNRHSGLTQVVKHTAFRSLLFTHHFLHHRLEVVAVGQQHSPSISSEGGGQQWDRHGRVLCVWHLHRAWRWQGLLTGPVGWMFRRAMRKTCSMRFFFFIQQHLALNAPQMLNYCIEERLIVLDQSHLLAVQCPITGIRGQMHQKWASQ